MTWKGICESHIAKVNQHEGIILAVRSTYVWEIFRVEKECGVLTVEEN